MNKLIVFSGICLAIFSVACKKNNDYISDNNATIYVINGSINVPSVMVRMNGKLNTSGIIGTSAITKVNYGSGAFFFSEAKTTPLDILKGADSSLLKSTSYTFEKGRVYTLLVAGQLPTVEPLLIEEGNYPYISLGKITEDVDSVINVRFINLSSNLQPIDIKISGGAANEVTGLEYKGASSWKRYTAKSSNTVYQFQIIENGSVLLTQALNITSTNRFKNVAIVIRGLKGGTSPNQLAAGVLNYF